MFLGVRIAATSLWASPEVVTVEQASVEVGRSPGWIRRRLGVEQRARFHGLPEVQAAHAARPILERHGTPDLLLNASATPRQLIPDTAVFVARELGLDGIPAYSIHATCLSFVVALRHAAALVAAGLHRRVLVVSSEFSTGQVDPSEPESAALLGDGAAAALVTAPEGDEGLLAWVMHTHPAGAEFTEYRGAGVAHPPSDPRTTLADNRFHMNGPAIYRMARKRVADLLDEVRDLTGLSPGDFDLVVPHQASGNALASLPRYGFDPDRVVDIVGEYGNCIAASIPMALAHADARGRISRGDTVLLLGTGAGLSVAAAVLRW